MRENNLKLCVLIAYLSVNVGRSKIGFIKQKNLYIWLLLKYLIPLWLGKYVNLYNSVNEIHSQKKGVENCQGD